MTEKAAAVAPVWVVVLTSDPDDLNKLVEEPGRPKAQRITAVRMGSYGA